MTVVDIETAIARISCGIGYGVMYIAHGLAIESAKAIAEEWSRLAASAMINYTRIYPEKLYNKDKPLLHDTYTLLRGLTFNIDITGESADIYITIDDDIEPRNRASIQKIFAWQTYGVTHKKINIPARPVFYDTLGQIKSAKVMKARLRKFDKDAAQYNFDNGFQKGKDYKYTEPVTIMRQAKKSIATKHLEAKISDYTTGELRWL